MVIYVYRNHKAYYGRANGGGGRERLYTYRYTVTTRMTPALRWAAMRAILINVSLIVRDKVARLSTNHSLFEEKGEPKRNQAEALLFTSLMPYR